MINSENKPYFTAISAKYSALAPDDKEIVFVICPTKTQPK